VASRTRPDHLDQRGSLNDHRACHGASGARPPEGIRFVRSASAPLPPSALRRSEEAFGVPVIETYGMLEAASMITAKLLADDITPVVGQRRVAVAPVPDEAAADAHADVAPSQSGRLDLSANVTSDQERARHTFELHAGTTMLAHVCAVGRAGSPSRLHRAGIRPARMPTSLVVSGGRGGDMPDRPGAADDGDQQEAADGGCFAPLTSARYLRLTTFKRNGMPVSATVHGLVHGDRAYFRARSRSGTVKRLQHTDAVRVTPCTALGMSTWPPLDAAAQPLPGEEASRAAAELDRKYPVRHRLLIPLPGRGRRPQAAVYYELLADDAAGAGQDGLPGGLPAPLIIAVDAGREFIYANAATPTSLAPVRTPAPSRSCPSDVTRIVVVSMSLPERTPAAETRADQATATTPASSHIS
jgi:uncharacterized protein